MKMKGLYFFIKNHLSELGAFCYFFTCERLSSIFLKQQNDHNSPDWPLIMKISALLFLQLLELKKIFWDCKGEKSQCVSQSLAWNLGFVEERIMDFSFESHRRVSSMTQTRTHIGPIRAYCSWWRCRSVFFSTAPSLMITYWYPVLLTIY